MYWHRASDRQLQAMEAFCIGKQLLDLGGYNGSLSCRLIEAGAAVEIGRRFLQGDPKSSGRKDGANRRKEERQAQASQDAEARAEWKRVWNQLQPKSGDTPRCALPALKQKFPEACPSPSPFKSPQSDVVRFEPARMAPGLRVCMRKDL